VKVDGAGTEGGGVKIVACCGGPSTAVPFRLTIVGTLTVAVEGKRSLEGIAPLGWHELPGQKTGTLVLLSTEDSGGFTRYVEP
jgi:hypothetical protein